MSQDIKELKRLAEAATPGPWIKQDGFSAEVEITSQRRIGDGKAAICKMDVYFNGPHGVQQETNADYIAAANPATVLAMIGRIEELERIESAARKLTTVKGRYHTEQNYCLLVDALREIVEVKE